MPVTPARRAAPGSPVLERLRRRAGDDAGFTLVEALVVIGLLGVVATAIVSVTTATMRTERFSQHLRADMDEARAAVNHLRQELRQARRVQAGGCPAGGQELTFWVDEDQDRVEQAGEVITYEVHTDASGETVLRRSTAATSSWRLVARRLHDDPVFSCDPAPTDTRVVTIALAFEGDAGHRPDPFELETSVRLRNVP